MALMVMMQTISAGIKGAIPTKNAQGIDLNAKEYLAKIEENFKSSSKTYASTLIMKLVGSQYNGQSGIREHILNMCDMANRLKEMQMEISEGFLVHFIMTSLPQQYAAFKINYNTNKTVWSISELISYCVEEEERLKTEKMKDVVNMVGNLSISGTPKNQHESGSSKQGQRKYKKTGNKNFGPKNNNNKFKRHQTKGGKMLCSFCDSPKHLQKAYPGFKEWLKEQGKCDVVSFIDELFLADFSPNTWWIDSGATVHISNSLQVFRTIRTIRKEERSLRVADGTPVEVEGVGSFHLELLGGFQFNLDDVLYAPSLKRNLISVSALDDSGHICEFGNNQCVIKFNSINVGLAVRQGKLYMLSLDDDSVMNVSNVSNKRKRFNETSSKLWHCRLGHISRGRMERLIKDEILDKLDFSDSDRCIDCIKGKYAKTIKKGATRSSGVLELIHTDICGPLSVTSVDGYDSFITFTDDYSRYGHIYPIRKRSDALEIFKVYK